MWTTKQLRAYDEMFAKFQAGQITAKVWEEFCRPYFTQFMNSSEVRAIMVRLKFR